MKNKSISYHNTFEGSIPPPYPVVSPGFFSGGGTPRQLKGYHAPPPRRGSGGEGPPDGSEVSFVKTIQSISNIATFFLPKKSIFSKKNFEKLNIFYKNFGIVSKNYFKFSIFIIPYKSREIPGEFYYQVEKFTKKAQK